ncbi:MAG: hypothetical protein WC613_03920 [Candidatus Aenigmatarchaeota archaeon]
MDFFQLIIFGILFNAAIMLVSRGFRQYTLGIDSLPTISIVAGYTIGAAAGLWAGIIVAVVYHLMRIRTIHYMPLTILANAVVGILASMMAFESIFTAGIALLIVYHIISIAAVSVLGGLKPGYFSFITLNFITTIFLLYAVSLFI